MAQEHNKFKLFTAKYAGGAGMASLLLEIEKWVAASKVAPKSVGVEYLEGSGQLLMSIGYRDDEAYKIVLKSAQIGKLSGESDFPKLEASIEGFVAKLQNIICHELFVTDQSELNMIFMLKGNA
jgi:hypothetical protein